MSDEIVPIVMPKWGLAMTEGILTSWAIEEGQEISAGAEIAEIETTKITNDFESPVSGLARRLIAAEGEALPVGALLAVVADASVSDDDLTAFIAHFQESFVPEEDAAETVPEPKTLQIADQTLAYLKLGPDSGERVLLLHGFGADMNGWMFNQSTLAEDFQVFALDLPGHGKSSKNVGAGDVDAFAATVATFVRTVISEPVHLVGHSLGGAIAIRAASILGDGVASLSLIAPAGLGPDINDAFLKGFIAANRRKSLHPVLAQLVADPNLISRDMIEDVLKFKRLDGVQLALTTIVAANFADGHQQHDLRPGLGALSIPVSVVWGRNDKVIPAPLDDAFTGGVELTILDDAGHIPQMERAGDVNRIIKSVIEKATEK